MLLEKNLTKFNMNKYHVIKRDSDLNVTSNKRRKKGQDWFTQTKIGSRPLGSKCKSL